MRKTTCYMHTRRCVWEVGARTRDRERGQDGYIHTCEGERRGPRKLGGTVRERERGRKTARGQERGGGREGGRESVRASGLVVIKTRADRRHMPR